jgi:hypothetical protein
VLHQFRYSSGFQCKLSTLAARDSDMQHLERRTHTHTHTLRERERRERERERDCFRERGGGLRRSVAIRWCGRKEHASRSCISNCFLSCDTGAHSWSTSTRMKEHDRVHCVLGQRPSCLVYIDMNGTLNRGRRVLGRRVRASSTSTKMGTRAGHSASQ